MHDIEDELTKTEGQIGSTAWEREKTCLLEDITELERLLQTIETDTRD